jgi:hypothetical protein
MVISSAFLLFSIAFCAAVRIGLGAELEKILTAFGWAGRNLT